LIKGVVHTTLPEGVSGFRCSLPNETHPPHGSCAC